MTQFYLTGGSGSGEGIQGPQGEQGEPGEQGPAGEPGLVWQGPWDSETMYSIGDAVSHMGSSYIALTTHSNSEPPSSDWGLVAARGSQGEPGETGATGDTGTQGDQGPPGIEWLGAWDSETNYVATDAVHHLGSAYIAVDDSTNSEPPSADWDLLAERGSDGATGEQGETGETGATGSPGADGLNANRNLIYNGEFSLWQLGTSRNLVGASANWFCDGFRVILNGSPDITFSRQNFAPGQTDVPGLAHYMRMQVDTAPAGGPTDFLELPIEGVERFSGQTVTFSFWARAASAFDLHSTAVYEMGSGGTGRFGAADGINHSVTTSWQRFEYTATLSTLVGETIGAGNWLSIRLLRITGALPTLELAGLQLEFGDTATPFELPQPGETLRRAQRHYFKTFPLDTVPAAGAGMAGAIVAMQRGNEPFLAQVQWPTMRATPDVTTYSPDTGSGWYCPDVNDGQDREIGTVADRGTWLSYDGSGTPFIGDHFLMGIHLVADARLGF